MTSRPEPPAPMPRKLPPLGALRAFEAAARRLSFQKAADELAVTPTAISHQIRLLEDSLGVALFIRHVRRVSLTMAGLTLFPAVRDGLDGMATAVAALRPPPVTHPVLTLSATTLFTGRRLIPALARFRARHPDIDLRLHATEAIADLEAGAADAAVRYGTGPFPGLVSLHLCDDAFGVLASPRLGLRCPRDLAGTTLLHVDWHHRSPDAPGWSHWRRLAGASWLDTGRGLRFTDDGHALQLAIAGEGALIGSLVLLRDELASGVLVQPFGPLIPGAGYHLVATPARMASPEVQALRDWLSAACTAA
ncbi:LysR family transcriptional regulator [Tistrella bauzanensis]|uniref:LysR family transcriptional regulator n=1 Tax=Tistrella bauzanensis TaxID=657419 RepID=A0ABQ1III3_9PROT|nr:LysR substrate-binding domain-containing protein [Tistrella bauzanensis]GGB42622.1 LysR family transcriptional regulator [Tistrella bauzanensis]